MLFLCFYCLEILTPWYYQDEEGQHLCSVTESALYAGIRACGTGKPFKDIGKAIHEVLKHEGNGKFSIAQEFSGHGIGEVFHMEPWILHHREWFCSTLPSTGTRTDICEVNDEPGAMEPGHCFTIEVSMRDRSAHRCAS